MKIIAVETGLTLYLMFYRLYIWEILHLTIRKKNKHVMKLTKELTEAREKLRRVENRSGSSSEDEDKDKGERPSEEVVERMEEKLEAAQADQKNLFLIIFQASLILF